MKQIIFTQEGFDNLGKEVIGKKAGDSITIHTPSGIKKYVIVSINK